MNEKARLALLKRLPVRATDGVFVVSNGVILDVNEAGAQLIGGSTAEVVGQSTTAVLGHDIADLPLADDLLAGSTEVTRLVNIAGRRLLVTASPVKGQPGDNWLLVVTRDMGGTKALLERLRELFDSTRSPWADTRQPRAAATAQDVIAFSPVMQAKARQAERYARSSAPTLLLGETGTGKNVFARLIHEASVRHAGALCSINCGAIPEALVEAELFGYVRGAFTGADPKGKVGLLELAHRGTLFLDEVGELPPPLQVKLLRFLETGEMCPLGGTRSRRVDVRIIAATNRDLEAAMAAGMFRRDLFYRLSVLVLTLPPLRERPEDIRPLVDMMLDRLAAAGHSRKTIPGEAMSVLAAYRFPGNVRELWNVVERLVVTSDGDTITASDVRAELGPLAIASSAEATPVASTLREARQRMEEAILRESLARYGTQAEAARHLGIDQATVARKLKRYRISGP